MPKSYLQFRPVYFLLIFIFLSACTSRPTAEAVSKFSVALKGASSSVELGLSEIQRLEVAVNDAKEAEDFIRYDDANLQFNRNENLVDAVIVPRIQFFNALSKYADSLSTAVSDDQIDKVRAEFLKTGKAFNELGKSVANHAGISFPADYAVKASEAFSNLAAFMVEEKLNREIPKIVSSTHDDLKAGVEAFKKDLGDPKAGGFRSVLNDSVKILIGQKKKYLLVIKAEGKTSKAALYSEVLKAQAEVRKLKNTDRLLAAIPKTLDELIKAHKALMNPKDKTTLGKIEVFFDRAKELQAILKELKA
ncbi:MAG: hypothetical protein V7776_03280 [Halopseudomonas aestusnigri]